MFIFGTNTFGNQRCSSLGCQCSCETSATNEGTCNIIDNNGFRLYKYTSGDYHTLYNKNVNYRSIASINIFIVIIIAYKFIEGGGPCAGVVCNQNGATGEVCDAGVCECNGAECPNG